jgi:hypothetical protein
LSLHAQRLLPLLAHARTDVAAGQARSISCEWNFVGSGSAAKRFSGVVRAVDAVVRATSWGFEPAPSIRAVLVSALRHQRADRGVRWCDDVQHARE